MPGLVEIRSHHQPTPPPEPAPTQLEQHLDHFRRRVLVDALQEATAAYWRRRATTFTRVGNPACDQTALACARYADLVTDTGLDAEATAVIDVVLTDAEATAWE
jgi:hypothetical protein